MFKEIQILEDQFASGKLTIAVSPVKITSPYNDAMQEEVKKLQVAQTNSTSYSDEFVVNKGASFVLTLIGDREASKKVKTLLDDENLYDNDKTDKLLALFATYNLRVKEIEEYKEKYGSIYFSKLEELKKASAEYSLAGERDKEDLLEGFREIAVEELFEHANCNLEVLFEKEPTDFTIDDALINEYGFKNIQTFLRYADDMNKIRVFPSDHYNRANFETLVELKLAIRGSAIPLEELLLSLTLKDLNELAGNPEKLYKRKNQAVEYILTIPNIEEKIGRKISLRELFKLQHLPEKYAHINLKKVSDSWRYLFEIIHLLIDTHRSAFYSLEAMKNKDYAKGFTVECWNNENVICPRSKDFIGKKYSLNKPPAIPVHIGCNCMLRQEYNF